MAPTIAPSELRSGKTWKPGTESSWLHGPPIIVIGVDAHGRAYQEKRTSNNTYRADPVNGSFAPEIGEGVSRGGIQFSPIEGWRDGIKPPALTEYITLPETETIGVESFHDIPWQAPPGQTPLHNKHTRKFYVSRINDAGRVASELHNTEQLVKRYDETNISEAIAEGSGKFSGSIDYLVIGGLPEGAAYGIGRAEDGGIVLAVARGVYEKASLVARELGIPVENLLYVPVAEEDRHRVRRSFDKKLGIEGRIKEEDETKGDVHAKLEELAEGAKGDPRTRYRRAQQIIAKQAETMGRMKATVRQDYIKLYSQDKAGDVKAMLYMDALEQDLRGEEAERYVSEYLAKIRDEVEGKDRPAGRDDRDAKDKRPDSREPQEADSREPEAAEAAN